MAAKAQDNYEIQFYGSDTVAAGRTMVELHSNYTVDGQQQTINGVLPDQQAFHETLEITEGITPWFETGFYVVDVGIEYYSSLGEVGGFGPWDEQQHQIFPTLDLNLAPDLAFNFGLASV
ncbi:MAG TPA: hypothetical protein VG146_00125 [Verrucomicrobiae bacterium]|nr:hypothetical protein [Verrucomicrobiae bacterium]